MSLPAIVQHLQVLETSGLVGGEKIGRRAYAAALFRQPCASPKAGSAPAGQQGSAAWTASRSSLPPQPEQAAATPRTATSAGSTLQESRGVRMSNPITHASFTLERKLSVPPSRVFQAFSDYESKKKWFGGPPEWTQGESSLDFRVGGRETDVGGPEAASFPRCTPSTTTSSRIERIVYTYEMLLNGERSSVSLSTVELEARRRRHPADPDRTGCLLHGGGPGGRTQGGHRGAARRPAGLPRR